MWSSQLKAQQLCQYRGMSGMIIANMYEEWLRNDCEDSLDHIHINVNKANMHETIEGVGETVVLHLSYTEREKTFLQMKYFMSLC